MSMKIVGDSCFDLNKEIREDLKPELVPLTLYVSDKELRDDENLKVEDFLDMIKKSPILPKSASPSPHDFMKAFEGEESVFAVTLSSQLSSSYSSAVMAKNMFLEECKNKFIHVFDSCSASIGQTLIGMKIKELYNQGKKEAEIVEKVNEYIKEMKTLFVLESLETLIKAGRINKFVGKIGDALSIKLIMGSTIEGKIQMEDKARGAKKAFKRMIEIVQQYAIRPEEKILGIAHVNCREKAEELKLQIQQTMNFKDIVIVEGAGITCVYAGDGGIVLAF